MIDFWEVVERCSTGQRMKESDYDTLLWKSVSKLTGKYDIKFDPDQIIPQDDALADRAWQAGLELFLEVGFYCLDTRRIVRFTRDEVEQRLATAPDSYVWGQGKDQGITTARNVFNSMKISVHKPKAKLVEKRGMGPA